MHPSLAEGRSNAVEEARASGLAIVATDYPTVAGQVTDGETGLVCETDPHALARAVRRVLEDPSLARQLGDAARSSYETETDDAMGLVAWLFDPVGD